MDELNSLSPNSQTRDSLQGRHVGPPSYAVGIATSVDQLKSLASFLDAMPVDSGMVFIIFPLSPDGGTHITSELLSRHTEMPIHGVVDETPLERDVVYLIPPNKKTIIVGGTLLPVDDESGRDLAKPDSFFRSLAQDFGERAIAILLSEQRYDGHHGMLPIGEAGGLTIHLDITTESGDIPTASIADGPVHLVLPPSKIAEAVLAYVNREPQVYSADLCHDDLHLYTDPGANDHQGKRHDQASAAANAQLAEVLNAATQIAICATNIDGTITLFNSGAENMLGYQASEMVGKQTPEIMHLSTEIENRGKELSLELGRPINGFEVFVAYAKEGRFERREWTYVRKDGRQLTVNLVVTAVRNARGEINGFLGLAEDISDRKKSEEALRKSEERFDLAVAGSNDGIWDWDVCTNEVYYAPRFRELLGYNDDEFENTFASFQTHLHPEDRTPTLARIRRHLEDREPYDVECRLRTKSGEYRWFRARAQAVWDNAGRAVRMAGSLTDLTKRKYAEAALERKAAEVQRANHTLRIAEASARKAVIQRDQFLAMLSHELRNPLSAILHGLGVLEHPQIDRQLATRARQAIRRQVHHISRLLDDLLDVARITQGKIEFRREVLDLNDLIYEAAQTVQPAVESRQQHLSVVPALEPVMVEGDPTRLLQIVQNLLTNASKYTQSEGAISVELKKQANECEICVQDNGRGIDPDMLDEIFDLFFQSNNGLDRSDGGMGVGLTLVRSLVEMHHGAVTAHSDGLGQGSQFVIKLPLTSKSSAKSVAQTPLAGKGATRVLLIEDNHDTRDMLQTILTLDGFDVGVAADGEQGLDAILTQRPDVAVIDIGLPRLNGYEVARQVRKHLNGSEVRLVALTGYGQAKDREAVFEAGFDEHLVKPVNPQELARVLNTPRKPR